MAKMFVHYNGSVDNFKKINNYAKTYNNSIVFISGGENEEGAAIYTHGKFYANIKDVLDLAGQLAGLKIIKGIKVDGTERVAANHDGIIEFKAADNATVTVEGTSTGIKIGLEQAFVDRVTAAEGAIAKEVEDRGKEITRVEGVVSGINDRVTAIEGTANDPSSVNSIPGVKQYAVEKALAAQSAAATDAANKVSTAKSEIIGASSDAYSASTIYGAKKYADEKTKAAQTAAASDASTKASAAEQAAKAHSDANLAAAKAYADQAELDAIATADTNADSKIDAAIGALGGDKAGEADHVKVQVVTKGGQVDSVVVTTKDIASAATLDKVKADVDAFFKDALGDTDAQLVKDTLREIQDYINSDVQGAEGMIASIKEAKDAADAAQAAADAAQGDVDALGGVVAGVKATAEAAATKVALQEEIDRAKGAEQNLQAAINVINGTEAGSISKAVANAKAIIDAYTVNGKAISTNPVLGAADIKVATDKTVAQAISALETAVGEGGSVTTQINSAIDKLDAEITSADGSHVTVKVTEVNGVITAVNVTESDIASEKGLADAVTEIGKKVNKADYDTKVAELEAMWVWEER